MVKPRFKVGDWLIHKATGHILQIDIVITWLNSTYVNYSTTWVYGDSSFPIDSEQSEENLLEYFTPCTDAAKVLYSVQVRDR